MTETSGWVLLLALAILITFFLLFFALWFGWKFLERGEGAVSPYTGLLLRKATQISYFSARQVLLYLQSYHEYDNRPFQLSKAAFCRETGRMFPDCVTFLGTISVDWTFLQKRFPGNYVSWGSLNPTQQEAIREVHGPLDEYQTDVSSPTPSPRLIEPEYAYTVPGPLYVDIETKVLLGWKMVPETELEVLIVQKPIR